MNLSNRLKKLESITGLSGSGLFLFSHRYGKEDPEEAKSRALKDFVASGGDVNDIGSYIAVRHYGTGMPRDWKGNVKTFQFTPGKK